MRYKNLFLLLFNFFLNFIFTAPIISTNINVTYWEAWNNLNLRLDAIPVCYDFLIYSFGIPNSENDGTVILSDPINDLAAQISTAHGKGQKVLLSIGGATGHFIIDNDTKKQNFINSIKNLITTYSFDGIDLDIEGATVWSSVTMNNIGSAMLSILNDPIYSNIYLTAAPEWIFLTSPYAGMGYYNLFKNLSSTKNLSDGISKFSFIAPQLYNQGPANTINGVSPQNGDGSSNMYNFTIAAVSAFTGNTAGYMYIPSNQFVVGLPASPLASNGQLSGAIYYVPINQLTNLWNAFSVKPKGYMNWDSYFDAIVNNFGFGENAYNAINTVGLKNLKSTLNNANVTYWEAWKNYSLRLDAIPDYYNVIMYSFGIPNGANDGTVVLSDEIIDLAAQISTAHGKGQKVLLSIGGATGHFIIDDDTKKQNFINSIKNLITTYSFDGIDLDIEGSTVWSSVTMNNIGSAMLSVLNDPIYSNIYLTAAPEWVYLTSPYASMGYYNLFKNLSSNNDLNDGISKFTFIAPQLYNQGAANTINGVSPENGDGSSNMYNFTIAAVNAFTGNTSGYIYIPSNKFLIGLPASPLASNGLESGAIYYIPINQLPTLWNALTVKPNGFMNWDSYFDYSVNNFGFGQNAYTAINGTSPIDPNPPAPENPTTGLFSTPNPTKPNWINTTYCDVSQSPSLLANIPASYNVICVAFIVDAQDSNNPGTVTLYNPPLDLASQIQTAKGKGQVVLVSIGGNTSNAQFSIDTEEKRLNFENSLRNILTTYNFDGVDLDFEIFVSGGASIPTMTNIGISLKNIMKDVAFSGKWLTLAAEFPYLMNAYSAGGYYALLKALSDYNNAQDGIYRFTYIWPQFYNQGGTQIGGKSPTVDGMYSFIQSVNSVFTTQNNGETLYIPSDSFVIGLPSTPLASTGLLQGSIYYICYDQIQNLWDSFLSKPSGFMSWSSNWDSISESGPDCSGGSSNPIPNWSFGNSVYAAIGNITPPTPPIPFLNYANAINWITDSTELTSSIISNTANNIYNIVNVCFIESNSDNLTPKAPLNITNTDILNLRNSGIKVFVSIDSANVNFSNLNPSNISTFESALKTILLNYDGLDLNVKNIIQINQSFINGIINVIDDIRRNNNANFYFSISPYYLCLASNSIIFNNSEVLDLITSLISRTNYLAIQFYGNNSGDAEYKGMGKFINEVLSGIYLGSGYLQIPLSKCVLGIPATINSLNYPSYCVLAPDKNNIYNLAGDNYQTIYDSWNTIINIDEKPMGFSIDDIDKDYKSVTGSSINSIGHNQYATGKTCMNLIASDILNTSLINSFPINLPTDNLNMTYWLASGPNSGDNNTITTKYINIDDISNCYDAVIFGYIVNETDFVTAKIIDLYSTQSGGVTDNDLKRRIKKIQASGRPVFVSIGGPAVFKIRDNNDKINFQNSLQSLITDWGFNGIDISLEGLSLNYNAGGSDMLLFADAISQVVLNNNLYLMVSPEWKYLHKQYSEILFTNSFYIPFINRLKNNNISNILYAPKAFNFNTNISMCSYPNINNLTNPPLLNANSQMGDFLKDEFLALTEFENDSFWLYYQIPADKFLLNIPVAYASANNEAFILKSDTSTSISTPSQTLGYAYSKCIENGTKPLGFIGWAADWDYLKQFNNNHGTLDYCKTICYLLNKVLTPTYIDIIN
jgi:chitinase